MRNVILVGGAAGMLVAGYFLLQKREQLERRGGAIEEGLAQLGARYAEEVAKRSADAYMADVYGLTPERIAAVGRLAERLRRPGS